MSENIPPDPSHIANHQPRMRFGMFDYAVGYLSYRIADNAMSTMFLRPLEGCKGASAFRRSFTSNAVITASIVVGIVALNVCHRLRMGKQSERDARQGPCR
jgi:hypothetical protein